MSPPESPRVPLSDLGDLLTLGEPLPFRVLDAHGRMLLASGQCISTVRQMEALVERHACADAVEVQAVRKARGVGIAPVPSGRHLTWFDRLEQQIWALDGLLRELQRLRPTDLGQRLETFADDYIALVERHFDAALFVLVRQSDRRFALYALTHSLHTATVALLTARQLGWPADRQRGLVRAALTMNASIVELQARMAEQTEPPSKKQLEQIRVHPQQSAQWLRECGVVDEDWLAAVEDHHERRGGSGYPRGLPDVAEMAHVLRAADVFTAKISPRAFRSPLSPQLAARQLFQEEQGGPIASALIRAVGVYPPGDWVVLKSGELGVVAQRAQAGRAATVVALIGANGRPAAATPRRDSGAAEWAITGPAGDRSGLPRVQPEQIYGLLEA